MRSMGDYEVLSHVEMPECSIRIIGMRQTESVAPHFHNESTQIYTVLEHEVEAKVGERTFHLLPYETVRIEKGVVHSVRAVTESALVLSLSIPPLDREDHHVVE
ncbi:MAG: cupin domain-containing protein [Chloroflexi bacterium]|nr:cupin domain-containing protein [Chloroflexota bacterium]